MKMKIALLMMFLMGVGCSQSTPSTSSNVGATDESEVVEQDTRQQEPASALPAAVDFEDESFCPDAPPPSEWRGYEPSLPAWVQTADAIFVGTVEDVYHVDAPVYLRETDDKGVVHYTSLESLADCPTDGFVRKAMRIDFKDVEVLSGVDVGNTLSITMGGDRAAQAFGIGFTASATYPTDSLGNRVYYPGARVGAALFADDDGNYRWNYRHFEVINGTVHLQDINEERLAECSTIPVVTGIPDQFEGANFEDFAQAIAAAATQPLTDEEVESIASRHEWWPELITTDDFKLRNQTWCVPPAPTFDEDADEGDRDPTSP